MMMTLLISGARSLGNDIDLYLEPLVEELKDLWNDGIKIFDASTKSYF